MITNGCIQEVTTTGGGVNQSGDPISVVEIQGEKIDALIKVNTKSNKGIYQDGTFTNSTYEILIETMPFEAKRVKLTSSRGKDLGTFPVQSIQHLDLNQRVKILV